MTGMLAALIDDVTPLWAAVRLMLVSLQTAAVAG